MTLARHPTESVHSRGVAPPACLLCLGERRTTSCRKRQLVLVKCRDCGFVQQERLPTPAELDRIYADSDWSEKLMTGESVHLERDRGVMRQLVGHGASGPLLDVGAGPGFLVRAAKELGWDVEVIEISVKDATAMREAFGVTVHCERVEDVTLPEQHFGVVTMSHSLEHMLDPVGDLRRLARAVRDDGFIHIAVPNWRSAQRTVAGRHVPWIGEQHITYFTKTTLDRALRDTGFEPVHWETRSYPQPDYYFFFGLLRRLRLAGLMGRWLNMNGRPLEQLLDANPRIDCPGWRLRLADRFAKLVLALWPNQLVCRWGQGDELRVTARRTG